jgi:hypothetical protein
MGQQLATQPEQWSQGTAALPARERQHWLVSVDLETTGLSPSMDRVVQLAAVCELLPGTSATWCMPATIAAAGAAARVATFCTLVDPAVPIPPAASRVHGITDEEVAGAPVFAEALAMLVAFLEAEVTGSRIRRDRQGTVAAAPTAPAVCLYVVAHNGNAFDFPLFQAEMARAAPAGAAAVAAAAPRARVNAFRVLFGDTCLAARALREPLGLRSCALGPVHERLGGARAAARGRALRAHDALGDATAVSDIMTNPEVFRAVVESAREQWLWLP